MILPQTYNAALIVMLLSMLCWGSWANAFKLAGNRRFELFYLDYALGVLLAALFYAFTLGSLGFDGFSFLDDLMHAGKRQWVLALLAGVLFNLGNMLLVAAISVAGLAVASSIGVGTALVLGALVNSQVKPQGSAMLLFCGCGIVVAAIVTASLAYRAMAVLRHEQLAKAGKAKSTRRPAPLKGIFLSLAAGVLLAAFYPLVERAKATEVGLGPYSIGVVVAVGIFFSTIVFNLFFMNLPVEGEPVEFAQFLSGSLKQHLLGIAGGVVCATGIFAGFVATSAPDTVQMGQAVSYGLIQGGPILAVFWGIFVWREFKGCDLRIKSILAILVTLLVAGLAMLAMAPVLAQQAA
jgi:glucose uptake protein